MFYDAEHFFDGYKANPEYALQTLQAAEKAGADVRDPLRHQRRHDARAGRRAGAGASGKP